MKDLLRKILGARIIDYDYRIVSIYADMDNKLAIKPTGESKKNRIITELDVSYELAPPYTDHELESKLLQAFDACFSYVPEEAFYSTNAERAKASKEYNRMVKGKRLVQVFWNKDDGYMVEPHAKSKSRGFHVIQDKVIRLGMSIEQGTLARAVQEALEISEPY